MRERRVFKHIGTHRPRFLHCPDVDSATMACTGANRHELSAVKLLAYQAANLYPSELLGGRSEACGFGADDPDNHDFTVSNRTHVYDSLATRLNTSKHSPHIDI
jgi:hypothetical protein